jgi:hypothetical protein
MFNLTIGSHGGLIASPLSDAINLTASSKGRKSRQIERGRCRIKDGLNGAMRKRIFRMFVKLRTGRVVEDLPDSTRRATSDLTGDMHRMFQSQYNLSRCGNSSLRMEFLSPSRGRLRSTIVHQHAQL